MIITKIGTLDCVKCKRLNSYWEEIRENHKNIKFCIANPLMDNKILEELRNKNITEIPVLKIQKDNGEVVYKTNITTKKEFEEMLGGL